MSENKEIEIVSGDGSELDISPAYSKREKKQKI